MGSIKGLVKDTAIYGLSSIIGRFLNWLLVPLYTSVFLPAEYGVVSYVYAAVALALVVLTYGMETGFFRFANHERWSDPLQVYSTSLISLAVSSTAFCIVVLLFLTPISGWMQCAGHNSYVMIMAVCVAADAFTALPFSYLRYKKRPVRFAVLKLIGIGLNIACNLFFILLCPWLMRVCPGSVEWFYDPAFGIGYIFLSNLIASVVTLLLMVPELTGFRYTFSSRLWVEMIRYSAPLLVLGVVGIMNQTIATLIFPDLYPGTENEIKTQIGIYSANYKIAIVMVMFIQAFRFAYEPFIFAQSKERGADRMQSYSDAMKFFVLLSLLIFLGVMFYLDIIKHFINSRYYSGLRIVPVLMLAELFFGIHFNLSVWYKLTDKTVWGAWFSVIGLAVTIGLNVMLVPKYGYVGCAWAAFCCYAVIMIVNYFVGRKYMPIPYPLKRIAMYVMLASVLYVTGMYLIVSSNELVNYAIRAVLIAIYLAAVVKGEALNTKKLIK